MKTVRVLCLCASILFSFKAYSAELTLNGYWNELKVSFDYMYRGSYLQFTEKNNLYIGAVAVPALWYSFEHDDRLHKRAVKKGIPKPHQIVSDLAPVFSFPLIQLGFATYGMKFEDEKATQFARETFAAMYLTLIESAILSVIKVHERPNSEGLSKWEKSFRGKSSFPSGHVVPFAVLTTKTLQFYGPLPATIPFGLYVLTSIQRVRDGKHHVSDVVGGFFLSAFASEGVRRAGNYGNNHSFYKAVFEHNLSLGYIRYQNAIGPSVSFEW